MLPEEAVHTEMVMAPGESGAEGGAADAAGEDDFGAFAFLSLDMGMRFRNRIDVTACDRAHQR